MDDAINGIWANTISMNNFFCTIDWEESRKSFVGRVLINGQQSGQSGFKIGEEFLWIGVTDNKDLMTVRVKRKEGELGLSYKEHYHNQNPITLSERNGSPFLKIAPDCLLVDISSEEYKKVMIDRVFDLNVATESLKTAIKEIADMKVSEFKENTLEAAIEKVSELLL